VKHWTLALALTACCALAQTSQPAAMSNLLPKPASVSFSAGRLAVGAAFSSQIEGYSDARLQAAVDRFNRRLQARSQVRFAGAPGSATLIVHCDGAGQSVQGVDEDESYSLEVTPQLATLRAPTVVGALRGLETLLQLGSAAGGSYSFQAATIHDKPRFPWRGLLIDVCRHWEPVEVIKRNLDAMAAAKLNVFHWHLSEDQGFRVESKLYPKLQELGSDGQFYTQDQIRDVVQYARDRGIRVLPEFDMPGHVTAWLVGHPELASAPGPYQIVRKFGVFDPTFDPTREELYQFLDAFLGEMAGLFPDAYMHIGGDENNGKQWTANPAIVAFRKEHGLADNHALQAYFNRRLLPILQKHGKKMVGWDEIFHPDLPKDIVVQSWRGAESLGAGAKQGYTGILSNGYYLDHMDPAAKHYEVDPAPANSGLSDAEAARILGGEACMWGEHVTPETIDSRIWPRAGAIAERLWSPRDTRDIPDMYRRLDVFSASLDELGLMHRKGRDIMLRRLTGSSDIATLRTLVDTVKPVSFGRRSRTPITQQTPLTGLVDATPPESPEGLAIVALLNSALGPDKPRRELLELFKRWQNSRLKLERLCQRTPALVDAKVLATELGEMGRVGAGALRMMDGGKVPAGWRKQALALLDRAAQPHALVEFTIVPSMRRLVSAASGESGASK
jgi:hexosaminidase